MKEPKVMKPAEITSHVLHGGTQVKRFITREKDATTFILGLAIIDPGADHAVNVTLQGQDEAYFMLRGRLVLTQGKRRREAEKGEVVLFRAGRKYKVTNDGDEPAELLYVICPSTR